MSAGTPPYFTDVTGPVDFLDPADPVVRELAAADAAEQPRIAKGRKGAGRFTFKDRPLEYAHLAQRRPTWAEIQTWELGPETAGRYPQVSVYDWPVAPGVTPVVRKPIEWVDEPGITTAVVSSCCPECVYGLPDEPRRREPEPIVLEDRGEFAGYERRYRQ
jgi:hypothetical protein